MAEPHVATTEAAHGAVHEGPSIFGLIEAPAIVAMAMIVVIALMLWKKVPGAIGKALDGKIAVIRDQLAEAESLRKEAQALKAEYQAKAAEAAAEAKAMIERARHEADAMLAKAKVDSEVLVERRSRMAEEKIAAEEISAVNEVRTAAAAAAAKAATKLIVQRHDQAADEALVDRSIGELSAR